MKLLIIVENDQGKLNNNFASLMTAARKITDEITALVVGEEGRAIGAELQKYPLKKIIFNCSENYFHGLAENIAKLVVEIGKSFSHIMAPASNYGKNIMPRVAALLDVNQISDIVEVIDSNTFVRPIYAGNALATVCCKDLIKVMTVRCAAFSEMSAEAVHSVDPEESDLVFKDPRVEFVRDVKSISARPSLSSAKIVISGGRGLQSKENFKTLLEPLAEKLGAAIGASRAAVDAGYIDNNLQVGQTGQIVAPDLYIAIGLSGAIQHLAGMKDSKVIVSINKDPNAEIMRIADYTLEADLFTAIPELIAKLTAEPKK